MKLIPLVFYIFIFYSCHSQEVKMETNKDDNTLLWEISGNGLQDPGYLFGTFHLMCKADISFSAAFKNAIAGADEIYFEMDLDDPTNTLGALLFMNMKNNMSLKDLYTPEEYSRVESYFRDSLGMPLMMVSRMKPNFMEALLYPRMMPCKTISSMEEQIMQIAKTNKKEIKGFETIAEQAAVFDSIPYTTQAKDLLKTIDSIKIYKKYFDTMVHIYKSQQLSSIENMFNKPEFGLDENRDVMLDNRNKNWVKILKKVLPAKKIFMAVGAGHLVGENGLLKLLKKAGYTIRPLVNKN